MGIGGEVRNVGRWREGAGRGGGGGGGGCLLGILRDSRKAPEMEHFSL